LVVEALVFLVAVEAFFGLAAAFLVGAVAAFLVDAFFVVDFCKIKNIG
jgi:hypothetical protein